MHGRAERLRELDVELRDAFRRRFVGRTAGVLFESESDGLAGHWTGYSEHYVPVACAAGEAADLRGTIRRVRIEGAGDDGLVGRLA